MEEVEVESLELCIVWWLGLLEVGDAFEFDTEGDAASVTGCQTL